MARAFLAIFVRSDAPGLVAKVLERARRARPGLAIAFRSKGLAVACEGLDVLDLGDGRGVVLGRLASHARIGDRPLDAAAASTSHGQSLIDAAWGGYVAFLTLDSGDIAVVRAPLGDLPCYIHRDRDRTLLASSPRLIENCLAARLSVDWPALTRHLAFPMLKTSETCLKGIEEIVGGDRLIVGHDRLDRTALWTPWTFAARERAFADPAEAAQTIRDAAVVCVSRSVARYDRILLKLSGGLDSSIVAACLAQASVSFSGVTLVTDDASGDERDYACAVGAHLGFAVTAVRRDPHSIDIQRSPSIDLPRPSLPGFRQESDRLTTAEAARVGAMAIVDGGGGDNVFCALQSPAPVADCFLARGGYRHLGATAGSVARIAHVSTWEVLRRAATRAWEGRRNQRWPRDGRFLAAEALQNVPAAPDHAWLRPPPGILPGRAAHVALIVAAQSYVESLHPDTESPLIAPLLAQPLVESCLRVPSWMWYDDGLNRAAARAAFAADLPWRVVRRRSKGSPDAFVAQVLERHRPTLRDWLLGGELAGHGLIDRPALAKILEDPRPATDGNLHRLMGLLDAEVWARGWRG